MFGFFKKKKGIVPTDKVLRTSLEKTKLLLSDITTYLNAQQPVCVLYYFRDSKEELEKLFEDNEISYSESGSRMFSKSVLILSAKEASRSIRYQSEIKQHADKNNAKILFAEHYPVFSTENKFIETISTSFENKPEICFYVSLQEPLLATFSSEKIILILDKMGYKEGGIIQHKMISKSIIKIQKKVEEYISVENEADSAQQWFERNPIV